MATEVDPLAFQKGFAATQGIFDNARQNRLAEMAFGQKQQELNQQNALAGVLGNTANYDASGNLRREALPAIAQANPAALPQYNKVIQEQAASQAAAQKAQKDQLIAQFDWADKNMAGVQNQAQWDEFRARAAQVYPDVASRLPAQFDPAAIQANRMKMIPVVEQWKAENEQERFRQQQETTRRGQDLSAQTARSGQAITMRGQDLSAETTRRGQDLTSQSKADTNKEAQADKQRVKDANESLGLLDMAEGLLSQSTGSYAGSLVDTAAGAVGVSTKGAQAASQLKAIEGMLVSKMPKMSGPQSDKDVLLYKQMAGQIGDDKVPEATKRAALNTIRQIQQKYASPQGMAPGGAPGKPSLADIFGR